MEELSSVQHLLVSAVNSHSRYNRSLREVITSSDLEWDEAVAAFRWHGIIPLLYHRLSKENLTGLIPSEVVQELKQEYYKSLFSGIRVYDALRNPLKALSEADAEVIMLKGAALAETLYPEIALRPFGDIDILVREEDWPKIKRTLYKLDFKAHGTDIADLPPKLTKFDTVEHLHFLNQQGLNLELHFDLLQLGCAMRSTADAWRTAHSVRIAGVETKILSPEYQLLHLCVHLNKHGYRRFIWFADIANLLRDKTFDWEKLRTIARTEGVLAPVYYTLYYVNLFFGELVSNLVLESLKPGFIRRTVWERIWPAKKVEGFQGAREAGLVFNREHLNRWLLPNLILTGRIIEKLHYLGRKAFPTSQFFSRKYFDGHKKISVLSYIYYYFRRLKNRFNQKRKSKLHKWFSFKIGRKLPKGVDKQGLRAKGSEDENRWLI